MRWDTRRELLVLLAYALVSFAYFGWRVLPHPGRELIGSGADPLIFVWSFAWWPHAIGSWTDPFVTHALYAPSGANLAWTTSVPVLALAFSPFTVAFGPVFAYNLAAVLLPALAAFTTYRLCAHLTGSLWASLFGGYLFGFSSFVLAQQLQGHLNLTGIFLLPLVALVLVRFVQGSLTARSFAVRFGILLALQIGISTEITVTLTVTLAIGIALASLMVRQARPRMRALVPALLGGYGLAALLASPLLVYAALGFPRQGFSGAEISSTDLLNLVVPTTVNAVEGSTFPSVTAKFNEHESALFLGAPLLLIVVLYTWRARRSAWSRALIAGLLLTTALAIGVVLRVNAQSVVTMPWSLVKDVPGFDNVHASRFAVYVALASGVVAALWTAQAKGRIYRRPYALPILSIVALVPAFWQPLFFSQPVYTPFFADGLYRSCFPPGETLLVFPFGLGGDSQLWQAEAGIPFQLAEGYLSPVVFGAKPLESFDTDPVVFVLDFRDYEALPTMSSLLAFAAVHHVDRIVSLVGDSYPSERQLERFGPVDELGGVYVSPACGRPPISPSVMTPALEHVRHLEVADVSIAYCHAGNGGNYYLLPSGVYPANLLQGAVHADFVAGHGLECRPPKGYVRDGLAPRRFGIPGGTYPYLVPGPKSHAG